MIMLASSKSHNLQLSVLVHINLSNARLFKRSFGTYSTVFLPELLQYFSAFNVKLPRGINNYSRQAERNLETL